MNFIGAIRCYLLISTVTTLGLGLQPRLNEDASFDLLYENTTNANNSFSYVYSYNFEPTQNWAIRITTTAPLANDTYPILFVIKQERGITSWQIPMSFKNGFKYQRVSRTLCPLQNYPVAQSSPGPQKVSVDVSSQAPFNIHFTMIAKNLSAFVVDIGQPSSLTLTPSEPAYIQFFFPLETDVLLINVVAPEDSCAVLSLQDVQCPVYDLDRNVEFSGFYQTFSRQAGITVTRKDFKMGTFYVVLVLKSNDIDCAGVESIQPSRGFKRREKNVTISVFPKITRNEYLVATFGALGIFLLVYIICIIISVVCLIKEFWNPPERSLLESQDILAPLQHYHHGASYGAVSQGEENLEEATTASMTSADQDDFVKDDGIDMLEDANQEKDVFRTKTFLYVADLAKKKQKKLSKKSSMYTSNILTIAIFYGVPVVQLVYTYQKVLHVTGNQDICYYNFLCAHPFSVFSDFNHVFSNVGYVLLGILFLGLVWRRDMIHRKASKFNPRLEKYFGIPRHFGLYYAMGLSLIMEGILSGCYHVCPNYSNFQFDTAFMYIIAILCMLKIYQSRHPDINANAHAASLIFAIIVLIGVLAVFSGLLSWLFWLGFSVIHFLCCLLLSIQVYYMGRWKLNCGIFKRIYLVLRNDLCTHFTRPMYPDRLGLLLIANFVNWGLLAYGLVLQLKDFGTFLLAIFITNLLLYNLFYIIMKIRYREKILFQPTFYIALSVVTWFSSLYFFMQKNVSWHETPAQSRTRNRECLVFHFYDVHDIWHFLSSAALFFSFMVLLTLDDDLTYVPRDKIPVF